MKYFISYFGQLKNFTSNMMAVSTVAWEQAWFKGQVERMEELVCPAYVAHALEAKGEMCRKNCPLHAPCSFMQMYKEYLDTLDFNKILLKLELLTLKHPAVDTIVLMVYEKYDVLCAERPVLQAWFAEHGIELKEWQKPPLKITTLF